MCSAVLDFTPFLLVFSLCFPVSSLDFLIRFVWFSGFVLIFACLCAAIFLSLFRFLLVLPVFCCCWIPQLVPVPAGFAGVCSEGGQRAHASDERSEERVSVGEPSRVNKRGRDEPREERVSVRVLLEFGVPVGASVMPAKSRRATRGVGERWSVHPCVVEPCKVLFRSRVFAEGEK